VLTERLNSAVEKGYLDKLAVNKNPNAGAAKMQVKPGFPLTCRN